MEGAAMSGVPQRCNNAQEILEGLLSALVQAKALEAADGIPRQASMSLPVEDYAKIMYELVFLQAFYDAQKEKEAARPNNR